MTQNLPYAEMSHAELVDEAARLSALLEGRYKEIDLVSFQDGELMLKGSIVEFIAEYLAQMLKGPDRTGDPANYIEIGVSHDELGPLTLTLQRKTGKTAHELRREAENELAALRNHLANPFTAPVRRIPAEGPTPEAMRSALLATPEGRDLVSQGDTGLFWMNEAG